MKLNNNSILRYITIIDPGTGWLEMTSYDAKKAMTTENLVETKWLAR